MPPICGETINKYQRISNESGLVLSGEISPLGLSERDAELKWVLVKWTQSWVGEGDVCEHRGDSLRTLEIVRNFYESQQS